MHREAAAARRLGVVVVGAAALAAALRDGPSRVLSFGLCGGLEPSLAPGDLVIPTCVRAGDEAYPADAEWVRRLSRALPRAKLGEIVGSDAIVGSVAAKAALRAATGAMAADMESHGAARLALRAGVPFAVLRAVSDGADESLPSCAQAGFRPDGRMDVAAVARGLLARPSDFPALMRTARNAGRAMTALSAAARVLSAAG